MTVLRTRIVYASALGATLAHAPAPLDARAAVFGIEFARTPTTQAPVTGRPRLPGSPARYSENVYAPPLGYELTDPPVDFRAAGAPAAWPESELHRVREWAERLITTSL